MNLDRVAIHKNSVNSGKSVLYWINRELRIENNWSLIYALNQAQVENLPLIVFYIIDEEKKNITSNQIKFIEPFLLELKEKFDKELNIDFFIFYGKFSKILDTLINHYQPKLFVTDFNPLNIYQKIIKQVKKNNHNIVEIDSHNIVPIWKASEKLEYAAYTIRPKIEKKMFDYLDNYPIINKIKTSNLKLSENLKSQEYKFSFEISDSPYKTVQKLLNSFIDNKLSKYHELKNNPTLNYTSNISKYLHFGILNTQKIALMLKNYKESNEAKNVFLEELIIRKELSDNYCFYNQEYDSLKNIPNWAKDTLTKHIIDKRDYIYSLNQFEESKTHDKLWNAAQNQLIAEGKIHGYMRMYWAKKILEWTSNPNEALSIAIYLNDKYALDGIDPNGYVGILWSIAGVHDRPWFERPIFGKIRYMNYNGCKSKFAVEKYIEMFT